MKNEYTLIQISPVNRTVDAVFIDGGVMKRVPVLHFGLFKGDNKYEPTYYRPMAVDPDNIEIERLDVTEDSGYIGLEFDGEEKPWSYEIKRYQDSLRKKEKKKIKGRNK